MAFWFAIGVLLFTTALSYVLRAKVKLPPRVIRHSSAGEFRKPTADEGRAVPILYGTGLIEGPNVLWSGDYQAVPIEVAGETIGFKYYLGVEYGLCSGPIDRLIDLRFDQKVISTAAVEIPATRALAVAHGGTTVVNLPAGPYATPGAIAQAVTLAIQAQAGGTSRVFHGFEIIAGVNDTLHWTRGATSRVATLIPGRYATAALLATEASRALNASKLGVPGLPLGFNFTAAYNSGTSFFSLAASDPTTIKGDSTALGILGFDEGADFSIGAATPGDYTHEDFSDRFYFFLQGGDDLLWTNGGTNSHALFGMNGGAPDMTATAVADLDTFANAQNVTFTDFADGKSAVINAPALFGGERDEGGIVGTVLVYYGTDTQPSDDYLTTQFTTEAPARRGVCYAVARKLYQGAAPYLKPFSVLLERCPNGLGLTGDQHRIEVPGALGDDANPACMLFDLLTDARTALAVPESLIDVASFREAGATLFDESLGMSLVLDEAAEGLDVIQNILRHVDGVLFVDPETGLLTLELVRADYSIGTLPRFGPGQVNWVKLERPAWSSVKNVVKVKYFDRTRGHTQRLAQFQDLATIQAVGRQEVEELEFNGFSHQAAAEQAGRRALRSLGYPLCSLELEINRTAYAIRPASVFVLDWPAYGISNMICRAATVEPGDVRDNTIHVTALEDVDGIEAATFSAFD